MIPTGKKSIADVFEATFMTVCVVLWFLCGPFICLLPLKLGFEHLEQSVTFWSYGKHRKVLA